MPPKRADDRTVQATTDARLSRTHLKKFNRSEPLLSSVSQDATSSSPATRESSLERKRKHSDSHLHDKEIAEGAMTPSDDGGERQNTPSDGKLEKKKMKRFRLTHNQTRFLMSEFTRQAHPDAAHRERLSKEIPGLTPRQVQVWFQNRRAKLKRLTSNDRERMLKSRALPDDFDTTQVLRTPFDHKSTSETPGLLTNSNRPNDDEYAMSPMSAPSAGGGYFPPTPAAERPQDAYPMAPNRPAIPTSLADLHRAGRGAYPFPRSSSFSDAYSGFPHSYSRFSSPSTESLGHGLPYGRRPMDYGIPRPANAIVPGYDPNRPIEGSVSPTDQQEASIPYSIDQHGQQVPNYHSSMAMPPPKGYGGMDVNASLQPPRQIPALHSVPVSDSPDYRPYSYDPQSYPMNNNIPYTQANTAGMTTYPSDMGHMPPTTAAGRMNPPQMMDPMRARFGSHSLDYASYL